MMNLGPNPSNSSWWQPLLAIATCGAVGAAIVLADVFLY
jgi:hypothetical protein